MKNFIFIILLFLLVCESCYQSNTLKVLSSYYNLDPTTFYNLNDHENVLNNIKNETHEDTLSYTFNKEKFNENINLFKQEFIDNINLLIAENKWHKASDYLDKYYYLYSDDVQVINYKNYILSKIKSSSSISYSGNIEMFSFKPLIAYPKQAFMTKNPHAKTLDENNVTCEEFIKILHSLYEKNYVLINPHILVDNINTPFPLSLPRGKKPLVLVLEDVEYNSQSNGSVEKLIIDRNDHIATYTPKRSINDRIHSDNDFITILEAFVDEHPTFSLDGAKALIVVDGSHGIFGYNTAKTNATSKYQIKKATKIILYLKEHGYIFASSGYKGNILNEPIQFVSSLNTWNNEVKPIIGNPDIFYLNANINTITEDKEYKFNLLNQYGFKLLVSTDMDSKFESFPLSDLTYITCKKINGKTLRYSSDILNEYFNCDEIYDHINRTITYTKE